MELDWKLTVIAMIDSKVIYLLCHACNNNIVSPVGLRTLWYIVGTTDHFRFDLCVHVASDLRMIASTSIDRLAF